MERMERVSRFQVKHQRTIIGGELQSGRELGRHVVLTVLVVLAFLSVVCAHSAGF
jgi:Tfp pilus assembly protein PilX